MLYKNEPILYCDQVLQANLENGKLPKVIVWISHLSQNDIPTNLFQIW